MRVNTWMSVFDPFMVSYSDTILYLSHLWFLLGVALPQHVKLFCFLLPLPHHPPSVLPSFYPSLLVLLMLSSNVTVQ